MTSKSAGDRGTGDARHCEVIEGWLSGVAFLLLALGAPALAIVLTWPGDSPAGVNGAERVLIAFALPLTAFVVVSELLARAAVLHTELVWAYAILATAVAVGLTFRGRAVARERVHQFL